MPATALTLTTVTRVATGVAQPAQQNSDVTNGNSLAFNTGGIMLEINNTNAASRTVTIATPGTVDGLAVADLVITVAATSFVLCGPFPPAVYNQSDGSVLVTASGAAGEVKFRAYLVT